MQFRAVNPGYVGRNTREDRANYGGWIVVCRDHMTVTITRTRATARQYARDTRQWCDKCNVNPLSVAGTWVHSIVVTLARAIRQGDHRCARPLCVKCNVATLRRDLAPDWPVWTVLIGTLSAFLLYLDHQGL